MRSEDQRTSDEYAANRNYEQRHCGNRAVGSLIHVIGVYEPPPDNPKHVPEEEPGWSCNADRPKHEIRPPLHFLQSQRVITALIVTYGASLQARCSLPHRESQATYSRNIQCGIRKAGRLDQLSASMPRLASDHTRTGDHLLRSAERYRKHWSPRLRRIPPLVLSSLT